MKLIYKYKDLEIVEVVNRPSKDVKSPYLADVKSKGKKFIYGSFASSRFVWIY